MNVSGHVVKVKLIIFFLNLHIGYLNEVDNDYRFSGHVIKVKLLVFLSFFLKICLIYLTLYIGYL